MASTPQLRDLQNYVNGEFKSTQDDETLDIVNPSSRDAYAAAPLSGLATATRPCVRPGTRVRAGLARHHPERAGGVPAQAGRRDRTERRATGRDRGREDRKAQGPDDEGRNPADVRPDPVLRRRRPVAREARDGRIHDRIPLVDPARADRRHRLGGALELPDVMAVRKF